MIRRILKFLDIFWWEEYTLGYKIRAVSKVPFKTRLRYYWQDSI